MKTTCLFITQVKVPLEVPEVRDVSPAIRDAFRRMDGCDVERILRRAIVMRTVPMCIRGPYRAAMRVALVEATSEVAKLRELEGGSYSCSCSACYCQDHSRGGLVSQEKMRKRFVMFPGNSEAATLRRRRRRRTMLRLSKALGLVQMGELSAGRAALEAAKFAPGTNATLQQLQDPVRRPHRAREPIPEHLLTETPVAQFDKEEHKFFLENLRSARKGVAPGPSGMTCEHLRLLCWRPPTIITGSSSWLSNWHQRVAIHVV